MAKKGSLSLSVNAIVVIVLALTMLGIGISFTKGLFENADFSYTVDISDPTSREPIQLPSGDLKFSIAGKTKFSFKVKNVGSDDISSSGSSAGATITCLDDSDSQTALALKTIVPDIPMGSSGEFKSIIGPLKDSGGTFTSGSIYTCTLTITDDSGGIVAQKGFFITAQTK